MGDFLSTLCVIAIVLFSAKRLWPRRRYHNSDCLPDYLDLDPYWERFPGAGWPLNYPSYPPVYLPYPTHPYPYPPPYPLSYPPPVMYPPYPHPHPSYPGPLSGTVLPLPGQPPLYSPDYRKVWNPYLGQWVDQI